MTDLTHVFDNFTHRLSEHVPTSEAGVREILAASFREAMALRPADVEVESALGRKRIDIWVAPVMAAIELKYFREIPSGANRPMTADFGSLLADLRKLATVERAEDRVLVLVSNVSGMTHLANKNLLPVRLVEPKLISAEAVSVLAQSARGPAVSQGPWIPIEVRRIWHEPRVGNGLTGLAWKVRTTNGESPIG